MAGAAAGGFVTRAFESMLKECGTKKYPSLQTAIQSYLETLNRGNHSTSTRNSNVAQYDQSDGSSVGKVSKQVELSRTIVDALSSAGQTLGVAEAELVLHPLQLAFETKNVKILECALDCIHKLISYEHLEGDPGLKDGKSAPLLTDVLSMVCSCADNSSSESIALQVLKVLLTAIASTKFRVHGEPLLEVVKVSYNITLISKSSVNQATGKALLNQTISIVLHRMELELDACTSSHSEDSHKDGAPINSDSIPKHENNLMKGDALSQGKDTTNKSFKDFVVHGDIKGLEAIFEKAINLEDGHATEQGTGLDNMGVSFHDANLLFCTLCKMGLKEDADVAAIKKRALSLELLQGLLEGNSNLLTRNLCFINSVISHLSYTLLRATVKFSPAIFQCAVEILEVLLLRYREILKGEIGIYFHLIVIRSLDTVDGPVNQKISVLRMLEKLCKDHLMLAYIFINYDCDHDMPNLFERMIATLSRIAQGTQTADLNSPSQNSSVKDSSLQCLVNVVNTLVDWKESPKNISCNVKDSQSHTDGITSQETKEAEGTQHISSECENADAHNSMLGAAISEFNRQPSKGIGISISNNLVKNTPSDVADFLKKTVGLDKSAIGEYLGQNGEFPLAVMHQYVASMDFSGMKFITAIRKFLSGFRLPGDAQKIDQIMEKFAECYCLNNPEIFRNTDSAYVLAYAVIVLNTDAHGPTGWPKMSKGDFLSWNLFSDNKESPSNEMLEEVYDSIVSDEIEMIDDIKNSRKPEANQQGLINILNLAVPRKKSPEAKPQKEAIFKKIQVVSRGVNASQNADLMRLMVEAVGWPSLAAFAVILEKADNKVRILLCMDGFRAGIYIAHVLGMDTMRHTFLTSLVRFTFLHAPKEMRVKNVEALRALLSLCSTHINSVQDTWNAVLDCISSLEYITSNPCIGASVMQASNQSSRDALLQCLRELGGKPAEQVFVNSVRLPSDAIVEFFIALCGVSAEELKKSPARVFSLQKLVEISYYNMARIRMVWSKIWSVLANHFIYAGSHHDEKIATYVIDSLRQLVIKYLEHPELTNFTFQDDILNPFVVLMKNSESEGVRRLIVTCTVQIIKAKVGSLRSGWRSVFMIFAAAAVDISDSIVESAFENVEQVILAHFDGVVAYSFMDCVKCLVGFSKSTSSHDISLKAIALLRILENRLSEGVVPNINKNKNKNSDVTRYYWFPMLSGLSELTSDPRVEIRKCAVEVLFDLLNERGSKFSSSFWESIFHQALFPIFDQVREEGECDDWVHETCVHSLGLLCNLFSTFYKEVRFILPSLLGLLVDCAKRSDQSVAFISLGALVHLIEIGGHQFIDLDWDTLLTSIRDASYTTQPVELLNNLELEDPNENILEAVDTICVDENILDNISMKSDASKGGSQKSSVQLQRSQTIGQRLMGNMMGNMFVRSFTSKRKSLDLDASTLTQALPHDEPERNDASDSPLLGAIRGKCLAQMFLLGAIDIIQKNYWSKLKCEQKVAVMDILLSILEFTSSYNSYTNLKMRMHSIPVDRVPLNLLRQELAGTCIYLEILQKTTSETDVDVEMEIEAITSTDSPTGTSQVFYSADLDTKVDKIAEEKLVSFCERVLKEASDFHSNIHTTTTPLQIHRVLQLRSPVLVKVIKGMSSMNTQIFRKYLVDFYPLITKLICCEEMDVRSALGDLFCTQLASLFPCIDSIAQP